MGSAAAIAIVEKLAPIIADAMAPEVAKLFSSLPAGMVAAAPQSSVEVAVAANLVKAEPAFTGAEYTKVKAMIGTAVAIYATDHPATKMQEQVAWVDIAARASAGIAAEGLDVTKIPASTYWQMILSGIEMYRAGLGDKALSVEK